MFRVVITEILTLADVEPEVTIDRFMVTVDTIDLPKVLYAALAKPPRVRQRKPKENAA